jgi:hypothetical protein
MLNRIAAKAESGKRKADLNRCKSGEWEEEDER